MNAACLVCVKVSSRQCPAEGAVALHVCTAGFQGKEVFLTSVSSFFFFFKGRKRLKGHFLA